MERVSLKLPPNVALELRKLAGENYRSLNSMTAILLVEAMQAREIEVEMPAPKIFMGADKKED